MAKDCLAKTLRKLYLQNLMKVVSAALCKITLAVSFNKISINALVLPGF